jgi:outer membrane protein TolC
MKRTLLISFLLLVFTGMILSSEIENEEFISMDTFINEAMAGSRFQAILAEEFALAWQEKIDTPAGDFVLKAGAGYRFEYEGSGNHLPIVNIGLEKIFALSGTTLEGSYSISPGTSTPVRSTLAAGISQEIVKNAFGRTSRIKKRIAGHEHETARLQVIESSETLFNTLLQVYLEWYELYEKSLNAKLSVNDSRALLENVRSKLEFKVALPIDVAKSRLQLLSDEEELLTTQSQMDNLTLKVALLIGRNPETTVLRPLPPGLPEDLETISWADIKEQFSDSSRTSRVSQLSREISSGETAVALDDILPTASLDAKYSFTGNGYDFSSDMKHQLTIEAGFEIPILDPVKRSTWQKAKIDRDRQSIEDQNDFEDIIIDLYGLVNTILLKREKLALLEQKVTLAEEIAVDTLAEYNRGRKDLETLIRDNQALQSARLSLVTTRIDLIEAWFDMLDLSDQLLTDKKEASLQMPR